MIQAALLLASGSAAASPAGDLGRFDFLRSTLTTEGGTLDDGEKISEAYDLSAAGAKLIQTTSSVRPTIDASTVPGLRLYRCQNAQRMRTTVTAPIRAIVLLIHVPADVAPRDLVARDTTATTTKPALAVRFA